MNVHDLKVYLRDIPDNYEVELQILENEPVDNLGWYCSDLYTVSIDHENNRVVLY